MHEGSVPMGYRLEGQQLEVCTCEVICPCWVGRDPDGGTCEGAIAWHVEAGEIRGVDVSGLTVALLAHLPGNPLQGNWRVIMFIDGNATDEQQEALLEVFTGRAGGPVADFAGLVGEVVDVRRVPITFDLSEGSGRFEAGAVRAEVEALVGATGKPTLLVDTAFSTIPGSPAHVSRSTSYHVDAPALGMGFDISDRNAVHGRFCFEHVA
jgi:hypothetical protein